MQCSRSRPSRADGVVRDVPSGGRSFGLCRVHRPRRPVGPFGLSGPSGVSGQGHRSFRIEARAQARDHSRDHGPGRVGDRPSVRRPRRATPAATRATATAGRRRRVDRALETAPEPTPLLSLADAEAPAASSGRSARAALASLAAHTIDRPPGGLADEGS